MGERGISGIGYFVEGREGAGVWRSSWTVICCTFEALSCFIVWILCCNYHFRVTIPQPLNHSPLPHDIIIHLLRSKKLQAGSGLSHATTSINQSHSCNDLPTCTVALTVKVTFIKRSVYLFFMCSLMLFIACFVLFLYFYKPFDLPSFAVERALTIKSYFSWQYDEKIQAAVRQFKLNILSLQ